jgi:hypothetical protein
MYPSENTRAVSWSYAAQGRRGIYLSRHEYEDNDWATWNALVTTSTSFLPFVTVTDMQRLQPEKWLNDHIVDAYGQLCLSSLRPCILEHVRFISSLFWQGLCNDTGKQQGWKEMLRKRVGDSSLRVLVFV